MVEAQNVARIQDVTLFSVFTGALYFLLLSTAQSERFAFNVLRTWTCPFICIEPPPMAPYHPQLNNSFPSWPSRSPLVWPCSPPSHFQSVCSWDLASWLLLSGAFFCLSPLSDLTLFFSCHLFFLESSLITQYGMDCTSFDALFSACHFAFFDCESHKELEPDMQLACY